MSKLTSIYKSLTQPFMAKSTEQKTKEATKKDQKKWVEYAKNKKVKAPFFMVAGTVRRTKDGKAYATPADLFADGGKGDWSNVVNAD